MKPINSRQLEVFYLRFSEIKRKECTAFVLPKSLALKKGNVRTLLEKRPVGKESLRIRIKDVEFKRIRDLTDQEIDALKMDNPDEILPGDLDDCCYLYKDALAHLPEGHRLSWIREGTNMCTSCAAKVVDEIRESCNKREQCQEKDHGWGCSACPHIRYQVDFEFTSDSMRTCQYSEDGTEAHSCGKQLATSLTNYGCQEELAHFRDNGFPFSCAPCRSSLIQALTSFPDTIENEDTEEFEQVAKQLAFQAIWDTHWRRYHAFKRNPVVGLHTFEII